LSGRGTLQQQLAAMNMHNQAPLQQQQQQQQQQG
jgi:hypothetical protein